MAAPIVYRWDDANAPVARGERRSLCDILYACLVTGYGSKPGAGWTREWVNATFDKAVFRGNAVTGTGFFLRVDGATPASAWVSNVQGFESMSDIDNGLFPFNASAQLMQTSDGANTTARPWVLVADDRAFYLAVWMNITSTPTTSTIFVSSMFFGDIVSRYTVDNYACALIGCPSNGYGSYGYLGLSAYATGALGSSSFAMPRKASGVAGSIIPLLINGSGLGGTTTNIPAGGVGLPYTPGDQIFISRPFLNNAEAHSHRGWLPGFWYPCHNLGFGQLVQLTILGKNFLSFRHYVGQGYPGNYFISLDDWRA